MQLHNNDRVPIGMHSTKFDIKQNYTVKLSLIQY